MYPDKWLMWNNWSKELRQTEKNTGIKTKSGWLIVDLGICLKLSQLLWILAALPNKALKILDVEKSSEIQCKWILKPTYKGSL